MKRWQCVAAAVLMLPLQAWAQAFQPGETVESGGQPIGERHIGKIGERSYEYTTELNGSVVNGVIDGPVTGYGLAMDDPDRWVILPKRDRMTDRTAWYLIHYQTGLMLGLGAQGSITSVCVIGADFPDRPISVRVGTGRAFRFAEDCSSAVPAAFRTALLAGGALLVRGYEWPNDFPRDKEGVGSGFAEAMKLYLFLRKPRTAP